MAMHMRKRLLATLAALCGLGLAALPPAAAQPTPDGVKIGVIGPMTGPSSRYGTFAWRGASLAAAQINAAGGVLGQRIVLVQGDSQCTPVEAVSAARRMISSDHVQIIIGDICSSATLALEPVVEDAKVLLVNAASSNPDITYKAGVGGFQWTFRNYPTDEVRSLVVLKYAAEQRNLHKFAILSVDNDYGRGAIAFSRKYFARFGITVTSEDYFKDDETDFRPVLAKIKAGGAQAILLYGYADTTVLIARQMLEQGIAGKIMLVGNGDFTYPATIKAAPSVLNGAIEAAAWSEDFTNPRSLQFVKDYKATYGNEAPNVHAYTHWETLHLLAAAIQKAGSVDPAAVKTALAGITYEGATGKVVFDDHHQAELPMIVYQIESGAPVVKGLFTSKVRLPDTLKPGTPANGISADGPQ